MAPTQAYPLRFSLILFFTCFLPARKARRHIFFRKALQPCNRRKGEIGYPVDFTGAGQRGCAARPRSSRFLFPCLGASGLVRFLAFWPAKRFFGKGGYFAAHGKSSNSSASSRHAGKSIGPTCKSSRANIGKGSAVVRVVRVRHVNIFQDDP